MDIEELKAWDNMLGVILEPFHGNIFVARKGGYQQYIYADDHDSRALQTIKNISGLED